MREHLINGVTAWALICLSCVALLAVLSGYTGSRPRDEGAAAHIFQLAIVALVPTIMVFVATADWKRPVRAARPLALAAVTLIAAFAALYHLEHP